MMECRNYCETDIKEIAELFYEPVHASVTARSFFEYRGYKVRKEQQM